MPESPWNAFSLLSFHKFLPQQRERSSFQLHLQPDALPYWPQSRAPCRWRGLPLRERTSALCAVSSRISSAEKGTGGFEASSSDEHTHSLPRVSQKTTSYYQRIRQNTLQALSMVSHGRVPMQEVPNALWDLSVSIGASCIVMQHWMPWCFLRCLSSRDCTAVRTLNIEI